MGKDEGMTAERHGCDKAPLTRALVSTLKTLSSSTPVRWVMLAAP
jgi:hypothetical protein